jgi:hypothetical protein
MFKVFAIVMSSLILVQSLRVDYDDIVQFDELIKHAQFHKMEHGDNFFVFLSKHYGELKEEHNKEHQEEKTDHEQLPFQCHDHLMSVTVFVLQKTFTELNEMLLFETENSNFHYQSSLSSLHKKGPLQPPKRA